ncbi:PREDICTED: uncharacterized protein LOC105367713 [Ceratosolen solmsi marchali]|uniref:Uncharacterized protein LOC105367713 n=1 Tax=Ceratosolen solmsi marchali TaxID=326594 RepID=A0AAJ6YUV3_9HYME|nr:PREDICTED: uncharacterized protein LOC105367713 [Ceratosolen solmsi marchali]
MKLEFSIAALLLLVVASSREADSREITHEDIKDAMLSLVHMMRDNTEKLERHEARDRQTAEQLKKAISLLTKRMSTIDGLKTYFVKLDERVSGIEQLITQKDERERTQIQKIADTLEDLESRLEGWATEIETKVVEGTSRLSSAAAEDKSPETISRIEAATAGLAERIVKLDDGLDARLKLAAEKASSRDSMGFVLDESKFLYGYKLTIIGNIGFYVRVAELQTMHNETQMFLQETKHALKDAIVQGNEGIELKMAENKEETRDSITSLRSDLTNNAERINQELHDLGKGQSVMVEMADHVLDTKKRLEHAYKILREVGELVMAQGLNINHTLNSRFDGISNDIMDNQNGALANLTVKMEQEMNQVWRQINVMYQQMMESAKALDKLHKQNEAYVNGTTSTMDGMESKVGEITKRMSEVDTNLNYLLGRLSLVTQEFNQIKQGLGAALDNIKASFKEVQERANDLSGNPGPHPVPDNYKEPTDSSSEPVLNMTSTRR